MGMSVELILDVKEHIVSIIIKRPDDDAYTYLLFSKDRFTAEMECCEDVEAMGGRKKWVTEMLPHQKKVSTYFISKAGFTAETYLK